MRFLKDAGPLGRSWRAWIGLAQGRRGTIAVWIAVMFPGLIVAISLAVEAGGWAAAQMSVQRTADVSAIAGALNYSTTQDMQKAAKFAGRMAQLNGGNGAASPVWTGGSTNTLSDNQITVHFVPGWKTSTDTALTVTVQRTIPSGMSNLFSTTGSYTVTGTGSAELITSGTIFPGSGTGTNGAGGICLLALSSSGSIIGSGSTAWTMPSCTVKSNNTITVSGGGSLNTAGIYARGAINIPTYFSVTGGQNPNTGITYADPFANYTPLQNALTATAALTGVTNLACGTMSWTGTGPNPGNNNCNGNDLLPHGGSCTGTGTITCTLQPGTYGSFTATQGGPYIFNLQPGLYQFHGAISLGANTTVNGTGGVTIITSGQFTGGNTFTFNITAPTPAQVASQTTATQGVAGIAIAGNSSSASSISGAAAFNVTGVVYFPNAAFNASGSNGNSSTTCLEIIAASIQASGNSYYSSTCNAFNSSTTSARTTH